MRIDCFFYRSIFESGDVAPLVMHDIAMHVLARTYVHTSARHMIAEFSLFP